MEPTHGASLSIRDQFEWRLADNKSPIIKEAIVRISQLEKELLQTQDVDSVDVVESAEGRSHPLLNPPLLRAVEGFSEEVTIHPIYYKIFVSRNARKIILDSSYELLPLMGSIQYYIKLLELVLPLSEDSDRPYLESLLEEFKQIEAFEQDKYAAMKAGGGTSSPETAAYRHLCGVIKGLSVGRSFSSLIGQTIHAYAIRITKISEDSLSIQLHEGNGPLVTLRNGSNIKALDSYQYDGVPTQTAIENLSIFFLKTQKWEKALRLFHKSLLPYLNANRESHFHSKQVSRTCVTEAIRFLSLSKFDDLGIHRRWMTLSKAIALKAICDASSSTNRWTHLRLLLEASRSLILRCSKTTEGAIYKTMLSAEKQAEVLSIAVLSFRRIQVLMKKKVEEERVLPWKDARLELEALRGPFPNQGLPGHDSSASLYKPLSLFDAKLLEEDCCKAIHGATQFLKLSTLSDLAFVLEFSSLMMCLPMPDEVTGGNFWQTHLKERESTCQLIQDLSLFMEKARLTLCSPKVVFSAAFVNSSLKCMLIIALATKRYERDLVAEGFPCFSCHLDPFDTRKANPSLLEPLFLHPYFICFNEGEIKEYQAIYEAFRSVTVPEIEKEGERERRSFISTLTAPYSISYSTKDIEKKIDDFITFFAELYAKCGKTKMQEVEVHLLDAHQMIYMDYLREEWLAQFPIESSERIAIEHLFIALARDKDMFSFKKGVFEFLCPAVSSSMADDALIMPILQELKQKKECLPLIRYLESLISGLQTDCPITLRHMRDYFAKNRNGSFLDKEQFSPILSGIQQTMAPRMFEAKLHDYVFDSFVTHCLHGSYDEKTVKIFVAHQAENWRKITFQEIGACEAEGQAVAELQLKIGHADVKLYGSQEIRHIRAGVRSLLFLISLADKSLYLFKYYRKDVPNFPWKWSRGWEGIHEMGFSAEFPKADPRKDDFPIDSRGSYAHCSSDLLPGRVTRDCFEGMRYVSDYGDPKELSQLFKRVEQQLLPVLEAYFIEKQEKSIRKKIVSGPSKYSQLSYLEREKLIISPVERATDVVAMAMIMRASLVYELDIVSILSVLKANPALLEEPEPCREIEVQLFKTLLRFKEEKEEIRLRAALQSPSGAVLVGEALSFLWQHYDFLDGTKLPNVHAISFLIRLQHMVLYYNPLLNLPPIAYETYLKSPAIDEIGKHSLYWHRAFDCLHKQSSPSFTDFQMALEAILYESQIDYGKAHLTSHVKAEVLHRLHFACKMGNKALISRAFAHALYSLSWIQEIEEASIIPLQGSELEVSMGYKEKKYSLDLCNGLLYVDDILVSSPINHREIYALPDYKELFQDREYPLTTMPGGITFHVGDKKFRIVEFRVENADKTISQLERRLELEIEGAWAYILDRSSLSIKAMSMDEFSKKFPEERCPKELEPFLGTTYSFYHDHALVYFASPFHKVYYLLDKATFEPVYIVDPRRGQIFDAYGNIVISAANQAISAANTPHWLKKIENPHMVRLTLDAEMAPFQIDFLRWDLDEYNSVSFLKEGEGWFLKSDPHWQVCEAFFPEYFLDFKNVIILEHRRKKGEYQVFIPELKIQMPEIKSNKRDGYEVSIESHRLSWNTSMENCSSILAENRVKVARACISHGDLSPFSPYDHPQLIYLLLHIGSYLEALHQLKKYAISAAKGKEIVIPSVKGLTGGKPPHLIALCLHILLKQCEYALSVGREVSFEALMNYYFILYLPLIHNMDEEFLLSKVVEAELFQWFLYFLPKEDTRRAQVELLQANRDGIGREPEIMWHNKFLHFSIKPLERQDVTKINDLIEKYKDSEACPPTSIEDWIAFYSKHHSQQDQKDVFDITLLRSVLNSSEREERIFLMKLGFMSNGMVATLAMHATVDPALKESLRENWGGFKWVPSLSQERDINFCVEEKPLVQRKKAEVLRSVHVAPPPERLQHKAIPFFSRSKISLNCLEWHKRSPLLSGTYELIDNIRQACSQSIEESASSLSPEVERGFALMDKHAIEPRCLSSVKHSIQELKALLEDSERGARDSFKYGKLRNYDEIFSISIASYQDRLKASIEEKKAVLVEKANALKVEHEAFVSDYLSQVTKVYKRLELFDLVKLFLARDLAYYKAMIPHITEEEVTDLFEGTATLLVEMITEQKLERLKKAARKYSKEDIITMKHFSEVLEQDFYYTYEQLHILVFEAMMEVQLRKSPDQLDIINKITGEGVSIELSAEELPAAMHFLMAGEGKTTVIYNIVMAMVEGKVPLAIVPAELYLGTIAIFQKYLSKAYGFDVATFEYDIDQLHKLEVLSYISLTLTKILQAEKFHHKIVLILTKKMCQLLEVVSTQLDLQRQTNDSPLLAEKRHVLGDILRKLKIAKVVVDEADLQMRANEALNIVYGEHVPLPYYMLDFLQKLWMIISAEPELRILNNEQDLISSATYQKVLYKILEAVEYFPELRLGSEYERGLKRFISNQISPDIERKIRTKVLCSEDYDRSDREFMEYFLSLAESGSSKDRRAAELISMLRYYLFELLPTVLHKTGRTDYIIGQRKGKIAPIVPTKAAGIESANDYADVLEAMTMAIMYYLQFGIPEHVFALWAEEMRKEAKELSRILEIPYEKTAVAEKYKEITGFPLKMSLDPKLRMMHLRALNETARGKLHLAVWVCSKDILFCKTRIGADSYTFAAMFEDFSGFSATILSNFEAMHQKIVMRKRPEEAIQAQGGFLKRWIEDVREGDVLVYETADLSFILKEYAKRDKPLPAAIADPCGELSKVVSSHLDVIKTLTPFYRNSQYKAFIYYDEKTDNAILVKAEWQETDFQLITLSRSVLKDTYKQFNLKKEEVVVYFDPAHCTGADFIFANDATMLMLVNSMTASVNLQTQMRMRKRMYTQRVLFAVSQAFAETLPEFIDCYERLGSEAFLVTSLAVNQKIQEMQRLSIHAYYGLRRQVDAFFRNLRFQYLPSVPESLEEQQLLEILLPRMLQKQSMEYLAMHGSILTEMDAFAQIMFYANSQYKTLVRDMEAKGLCITQGICQEIVRAADEFNAALKVYIEKKLAHILPDTMPINMKNRLLLEKEMAISSGDEGLEVEVLDLTCEVNENEEEEQEEEEAEVEITELILNEYQSYQLGYDDDPYGNPLETEGQIAEFIRLLETPSERRKIGGYAENAFLRLGEIFTHSVLPLCSNFRGYEKPYGVLFSSAFAYSHDALCPRSPKEDKDKTYAWLMSSRPSQLRPKKDKTPMHVPIFSQLARKEEQLLLLRNEAGEFVLCHLSAREIQNFVQFFSRFPKDKCWIISHTGDVLFGDYERFNLKAFSFDDPFMITLLECNLALGDMFFALSHIKTMDHWMKQREKDGRIDLMAQFLELAALHYSIPSHGVLRKYLMCPEKRQQLIDEKLRAEAAMLLGGIALSEEDIRALNDPSDKFQLACLQNIKLYQVPLLQSPHMIYRLRPDLMKGISKEQFAMITDPESIQRIIPYVDLKIIRSQIRKDHIPFLIEQGVQYIRAIPLTVLGTLTAQELPPDLFNKFDKNQKLAIRDPDAIAKFSRELLQILEQNNFEEQNPDLLRYISGIEAHADKLKDGTLKEIDFLISHLSQERIAAISDPDLIAKLRWGQHENISVAMRRYLHPDILYGIQEVAFWETLPLELYEHSSILPQIITREKLENWQDDPISKGRLISVLPLECLDQVPPKDYRYFRDVHVRVLKKEHEEGIKYLDRDQITGLSSNLYIYLNQDVLKTFREMPLSQEQVQVISRVDLLEKWIDVWPGSVNHLTDEQLRLICIRSSDNNYSFQKITSNRIFQIREEDLQSLVINALPHPNISRLEEEALIEHLDITRFGLLNAKALALLNRSQIQQIEDRKVIQRLPVSQVRHISEVAVSHLQASQLRYLTEERLVRHVRYALVLRLSLSQFKLMSISQRTFYSLSYLFALYLTYAIARKIAKTLPFSTVAKAFGYVERGWPRILQAVNSSQARELLNMALQVLRR